MILRATNNELGIMVKRGLDLAAVVDTPLELAHQRVVLQVVEADT